MCKARRQKKADAARAALDTAKKALESLVVPPTEVVANSLTGYAGIDATRAAAVTQIEAAPDCLRRPAKDNDRSDH